MNKEIEELKKQMSCLEDGELLVRINRAVYRQVTINLAIEELLRRRVSSGLIVDESTLSSVENQLSSLSHREAPSPPKSSNAWLWVAGFILFSNFANLISRQNAPVINLGDVPTAILSGLMILPLGIVLFELRERRRKLYAFLEIFFGIFYGIYTIGGITKWGALKEPGTINLATWTALGASLYIVVRGLDNRKQAMMQKEEEDREKEENNVKTEETRHRAEIEKIKDSLKQGNEPKGAKT